MYAVIDWSTGGEFLRDSEGNIQLFDGEEKASKYAESQVGSRDTFQIILVPDSVIFFIRPPRIELDEDSEINNYQ